MTTYRFFGHIIDQSTRRALPNLRVEAWDAEAKCTDPVAFATPDAQGAFTMALDDAYLSELFQDRPPSLAFPVFSMGETPQRLTRRTFGWQPSKESTAARIQVLKSSAHGYTGRGLVLRSLARSLPSRRVTL